jgi:nucleotide-binding universal stress UspA family protein
MTPDPHPVVVVGFDGSPASHVAMSRAIQRVGPNGKLYLVHAWHVPEAWRGRGTFQPYVDRALEDADAVLESAQAAHPGLAQISWESELIGAPPAKAIADVANVRNADEIIIGTRGFGRVRALLGSVAHELIHLAGCPVTVIPERMVAAGLPLEHARHAAVDDVGDVLGAGAGQEAGGHRGALP